MHLAQRSLAIRQVKPRQHFARQALRHCAANRFQQVEDRLALPARGQPRTAQRLVNRRDAPHLKQPRFGVVARVGQHLKLWLDHFEILAGARRLDPSEDGHRLPGEKLAVQITRVKPDALERQATLPQGQFENGHFAGTQQHGAAHLRNHAGHFAGLQFVKAARILAVLIAEGQVVEQVLGSQDALGRE